MSHFPPSPTLFPYTTLFRSRPRPESAAPSRPSRRARGRRRKGRRSLPVQSHARRRAHRRRRETSSHRRSEEHTSELQSPCNLVCRLLLEKKKYVVIP